MMLSFSAITPGMCRRKQKGSPQSWKRKSFDVAILNLGICGVGFSRSSWLTGVEGRQRRFTQVGEMRRIPVRFFVLNDLFHLLLMKSETSSSIFVPVLGIQ